jgi:hypothetical protein
MCILGAIEGSADFSEEAYLYEREAPVRTFLVTCQVGQHPVHQRIYRPLVRAVMLEFDDALGIPVVVEYNDVGAVTVDAVANPALRYCVVAGFPQVMNEFTLNRSFRITQAHQTKSERSLPMGSRCMILAEVVVEKPFAVLFDGVC